MKASLLLIRLMFAVGLTLASTLAAAETDFEVTMRMVEDEDTLDSSFVQEMELPDSVNELDVTEISNEVRELEETLASESRETRDALDVEFPGEDGTDLLETELPGTDLLDPDLDLLEPTDDLLGTGDDLLDKGGDLLNSGTDN
ncbi:MAG: hypothetical protein R6W86_15300 [Marinobacter sp.]|uniref:hypothetical protein n=1 Tax=Marinobacter sp. TaxID=50741 RepID=UPI00396E017B